MEKKCQDYNFRHGRHQINNRLEREYIALRGGLNRLFSNSPNSDELA